MKCSLNKLELNGLSPNDLPELCFKSGFKVIALSAVNASVYHKLPKVANHKDPLDRMLIWQAMKQDLILITNDDKIRAYSQFGLITLW